LQYTELILIQMYIILVELPGEYGKQPTEDLTGFPFLTLWEVYRTPYTLCSGGSGSAIYKSVDGGTIWKKVTGNGIPEGILGKIGLAVSRSNPDVVYAMIENENGGLFRSNDGGETWKRVNEERKLRQRAWYYSRVYSDPQNENVVYVLNTRIWKSIDGGKTFDSLQQWHGDNHALWIDPADSKRMINGNDGGANVSNDGGKTWTKSENPTAQFYHVYTDNDFPYNVYGAQQDNSTVKIKSRSNGRGITVRGWHSVGGGESGHIIPDPRNSDIVYAGSYGGLITRYDHKTQTTQNIQVWPENPMGWAAGDLKYRFQWTAPIMISPHDPTKLYHAANVLFRSTNEGKSWTQVSPDLTRNEKSMLEHSGGPITHDNTSVEYYCTIFALAESPLRPGLLWVETDDGLIHISKDDGKSWENITPRHMPEWGLISSIEPSYSNEGTAYIAVDHHELDDFNAYAYKTTDYGKSWIPINQGFREDDFLRVIREDPVKQGILYAGTETGVYYSIDDGQQWNSLQLNLPASPIHDLSVKRNDLIAGTHGRSFWILDDLTIIHQLRELSMKTDVLLKPLTTYRMPGSPTNNPDVGQNPPSGVVINYYLKEPCKNKLSMEILEKSGNLVRTFTSEGEENEKLPAKKGMNRFIWDMRYPGASEVEDSPLWAGTTAGPLAVPGIYTIKLHTGHATLSKEFEIKIDPRIPTSQRELEEQFDLLIKIRDKVTEAHNTVNKIRTIKADLDELKSRIPGQSGEEIIADKIDMIYKELCGIEGEIIQVKSKSGQDPLNYPIKINNKLAALTGVVSHSYFAPTRQSYDVFTMLSEQLDKQINRFNKIIDTDIIQLNQLIREYKIPAILVRTKK